MEVVYTYIHVTEETLIFQYVIQQCFHTNSYVKYYCTCFMLLIFLHSVSNGIMVISATYAIRIVFRMAVYVQYIYSYHSV